MVGISKLPIDKVVLMLVKDVDERCMLTKNQYVDKKLLSRRFSWIALMLVKHVGEKV